MRRMLFLLLLLLPFAAIVHAQTEEPSPPLTWTFADLARTYYLHVPADLVDPAPLVIALHGRFDSGKGMAAMTHFSDLADQQGFIVAYPDGIDGEWNFVRGIGGYDTTQDDTAFLVALIDHIAQDHPVDKTRVYLAGFSNGGLMVQRAACENPAPFAAFASVAAAAFGGIQQVCPQTSAIPIPMLLINGTADQNIPWNGTPIQQNGQTIYITYPVTDTLAYWAQMNNCPAEADTATVPPLSSSPDTEVHIFTLHCPPTTSVVLYAVIGGGHNWPGMPAVSDPAFGSINHDIDASTEIWTFFKQHQRTTLPEATAEATVSP